MPGSRTCVECGTPVPETANGFCPRCCLNLAIGADGPIIQPALAEQDSSKAGQSLGGYELLEQVGEGGMGVVFRARQFKLNRIVAVKMLRSGSLASKAEVKRFRIEAQAAARLQHPNIVVIHEVAEQEGQLFFSMDYIQGRSLSQMVSRTPLPPAQAARYTRIIAQAIHHAHTHGVLHRDLKPGNVLIDEQDQPRITDFGLAKAMDSEADVTLSGSVLGTPSYMSPEQASAKHALIGPATDIYSIGAILYDLLTGRPPFQADSPVETMRQVIERDPAPPRLLNAKIDRDLETICLNCLAKDSERRYESAQALADDLGRFLDGEPIRARRTGSVVRVCRWAKRHPSLAALSAAFALMFLLFAYFSHSDAVDNASGGSWIASLAIRQQLDDLGRHVSAIAANEELRSKLMIDPPPMPGHDQTSTNNSYIPLLEVLFKQHGIQPDKSNRFENLFLIHPSGDAIANYNPHGTGRVPNVSHRDYFQGAIQLANGVYVSSAFMAITDGKCKIGMSTALRDEQGRVLAVLAAMIGTASTDAPTGLKTERTKTVLVAELDQPTNSVTPACAIFWHPAYGPGKTNVVSICHPMVSALLSNELGSTQSYLDKKYRDPIYGGWWVAGFSRVPNTHLVVVYQVKHRAVQALIAGTALLALFVFVGFVYFIRKRLILRNTRLQTG